MRLLALYAAMLSWVVLTLYVCSLTMTRADKAQMMTNLILHQQMSFFYLNHVTVAVGNVMMGIGAAIIMSLAEYLGIDLGGDKANELQQLSEVFD